MITRDINTIIPRTIADGSLKYNLEIIPIS